MEKMSRLNMTETKLLLIEKTARGVTPPFWEFQGDEKVDLMKS
jgi:hypothetical protein